ncbi:relaxase MobL, partial [Staphylococcus epidermidis]|uniref:relaxase MobL n=1 Tax=Staphylococcus epidermidis TaxID=1282 RepID=UPI0021B27682
KLKKKEGYKKENVKKRRRMRFNCEDELMEEEEMKRVKDKFEEGNKKSDVMYEDVVCFDNEFVKENDLFNE